MILIVGDPNFRNMYGKFKAKIEDQTKETVVYKQYSTNESLKLILAAGLNQVAAKASKKGKGRDETIQNVVGDQNTVIVKQGEKDNKSI